MCARNYFMLVALSLIQTFNHVFHNYICRFYLFTERDYILYLSKVKHKKLKLYRRGRAFRIVNFKHLFGCDIEHTCN